MKKQMFLSIILVFICGGVQFANTSSDSYHYWPYILNAYSTNQGKEFSYFMDSIQSLYANNNTLLFAGYKLDSRISELISISLYEKKLIVYYTCPRGSMIQSILIDEKGDIFILVDWSDYFTLSARDCLGMERWTAKIDDIGGADPFLQFDEEGNIVLFSNACTFRKFDKNGELLTYHSCVVISDVAKDNFLDEEGNIYGVATGRESSIVYKFDSTGKELWSVDLISLSFEFHGIRIIADKSGSPYILYRTMPYTDYIGLLKLSPDGKLKWNYKMEDLFNPSSLAFDQAGNIIVLGTIRLDNEEFGRGFLFRKINPDSELILEVMNEKPFPGMEAIDVASDHFNNTYVMANRCQWRYDNISDCSDDLYRIYLHDPNGNQIGLFEQDDEPEDDSITGDDKKYNGQGYIFAAYPDKIVLSPNLAVDLSNPLDDADDDDNSGCGC